MSHDNNYHFRNLRISKESNYIEILLIAKYLFSFNKKSEKKEEAAKLVSSDPF